MSLPAWGVRVEIAIPRTSASGRRSLPAWGVRVEMYLLDYLDVEQPVTPRMGSAG